MTMPSTTYSPEDLILISVDDHICEPADMFTRQLPARWGDQAPRVRDEPNGSQQWYYGDLRGRNLGLNAVAGKPRKFFNIGREAEERDLASWHAMTSRSRAAAASK